MPWSEADRASIASRLKANPCRLEPARANPEPRPFLEAPPARPKLSEPQLSIRSAKAKALAQALARRTGMPMNRLVEQALERLDGELRSGARAHPIDTVWEIAAEGRPEVMPGATSAHDDLYDAAGLPK